MTDSIESIVRQCVAEQLGMDPAAIDAHADIQADLGADSLTILELVMALEERVGIEIPDDDQEKLMTVAAAVEYLEARRAGAESTADKGA